MKTRIVGSLLVLFLLIACSDPSTDKNAESRPGTFTVSIGAGNGRAALPWDSATDSADLEHTVIIKQQGTEINRLSIANGRPVSFSVTPGTCEILVEAKLGDVIKAEGSVVKEIVSGDNGVINILMGPPGLRFEGLQITAHPDKMFFSVGEQLDFSGLKVEGLWSGQTNYQLTIPHANLLFTGFDSTSEGLKSVSVEYGGYSVTFTVMVGDLQVRGYEVRQPQNKRDYFVGESINLDGLILEVYFLGTDETMLVTHQAYWIPGLSYVLNDDFSSPGEKEVMVSYRDLGGPAWASLMDVPVVTVHPLSPGAGTMADPFLVYSVGTLEKVGSGTDGWSRSAFYEQVADIYFYYDPIKNWTPIGTETAPFTGSYDGGGYTINELTINNTSGDPLGLFGYVSGAAAVIKNVRLEGVNISSSDYAGGVVGYNNGGRIENCSVTGSIDIFTMCGGSVVGYNSGTVVRCSSTTTSTSSNGNAKGGVVGWNTGTVENCYSTSSVGSGTAGGVVGWNEGGTVQNCYATGSVTGFILFAGGVVGMNESVSGTSIMRNCVALNPSVTTGPQTSLSSVGRVAVAADTGALQNNYANSSMTVTYDNGVGYTPANNANDKDGADVTAGDYNNQAWWTTPGNWNTTSGSAWDFTNVWTWDSGVNLPVLR